VERQSHLTLGSLRQTTLSLVSLFFTNIMLPLTTVTTK
jgi:hypothetical protein